MLGGAEGVGGWVFGVAGGAGLGVGGGFGGGEGGGEGAEAAERGGFGEGHWCGEVVCVLLEEARRWRGWEGAVFWVSATGCGYQSCHVGVSDEIDGEQDISPALEEVQGYATEVCISGVEILRLGMVPS